MQTPSISLSSPKFGVLSPAVRQAMMQAQYGLSANDSVALIKQSDALLNAITPP